jgi:hypothetical protein
MKRNKVNDQPSHPSRHALVGEILGQCGRRVRNLRKRLTLIALARQSAQKPSLQLCERERT